MHPFRELAQQTGLTDDEKSALRESLRPDPSPSGGAEHPPPATRPEEDTIT